MKTLLNCRSLIRVSVIMVVMSFMASHVTETYAWGEYKEFFSEIIGTVDDHCCSDDDWIIFGNDMYSGVPGNVGIGTMSPATKLHVHGSSNPVMQLSNDVSRLQFGVASGNGAFSNFASTGDAIIRLLVGSGPGNDLIFSTPTTGGTGDRAIKFGDEDRITMSILNNGKVGIGTTTPDAVLHVEQSGSARSDGTFRFIQPGLASGNDNSILFGRGPAPAEGGLIGYLYNSNQGQAFIFLNHWGDSPVTGSGIAIRKGGNVGIGTTNPDQELTVNGNASKVGGGSWEVFSDERLKTIYGPFDAGLEEVLKLQPISYRYNKDNPLNIPDECEHIGFSAQEVQNVIPEAVSKNSMGYFMVNNDPIMWAMLNAIKEQQAQIKLLKAENEAFKTENELLREKLTALAARQDALEAVVLVGSIFPKEKLVKLNQPK